MLLIKQCGICNRTFEAVRGQRYCSDQCRNAAIRVNKLRYQAKIINTRPSTKTLDDIKHEIEIVKTATKKYDTSPITYNSEVDCNEDIDYITKSINACKELDIARKKVQDIIDVLNIEQKRYNKEDFEFAHSVEGGGRLTDTQKLKLFNDYQEMRSKRRNVKDVIRALIGCIKYTPIDSEKILKDAISSKIKVDDFFKDFYKQRNGGY